MTTTKPSMEQFSADYFESHNGKIFLLQPPGGDDLEFELIEVARYKKAAGAGREPFSLVFRSVNRQALAPVLHTIKHEAIQPCSIFLSRIAPLAGLDQNEVCYEAVFS